MTRRIILLFTLLALFPAGALASVSSGTIDPAFHSTRICADPSCTNYGNINWLPTLNAGTLGASPVVIADTGVTGHLWGDEIGWVNMSPATGGVTINASTGVLSGYAYANTGSWINFRPTQAPGNPTVGVTITPNGEFSGYAYVSGLKGGWMKFDCTVPAFCVKTDWRPLSARDGAVPSSSGGGGGGGVPVPVINSSTSSSSASEAPVLSAVNIVYAKNTQTVTVSWISSVPTIGEVHYRPVETDQHEMAVLGSDLKTIHQVKFSAPPEVLYTIRIVAHSSDAIHTVSNEYHFFTEIKDVALLTAIKNDQKNDQASGKTNTPSDSTSTPVEDTGNQPPDVNISPVPSIASPGGTSDNGVPLLDKIPLANLPQLPLFDASWATLIATLLIFSRPLANAVKIGSLSDTKLVIMRIFGVLTFRRRRIVEPWGTVYDSVTKRPLDPAYVSLISNETGKEYKGSITDLDGRYGFLATPGKYTLMASKTHYAFPSKRLFSRKSDSVYDDLYFGGDLSIGEREIIKRNIPLDPMGIDWNEAEKVRMGIGNTRQKRRFVVLLMNLLYVLGFSFSLYAYMKDPGTWNLFIVSLYLLILITEMLWKRHFHIAQVKDEDGKGLAFALIKLFFVGSDMLVKKIVADDEGNFYLLANPGNYKIVVEKMVSPDEYQLVHTIPSIELSRGILDKDIVVPDGSLF